MRRNSVYLMLGGSLLAGVLFSPAGVRGGDVPRAVRDQRLRSIEKLDYIQKEKLASAFDQYLLLDPATQAHLRMLQAEIEEDATLRGAMEVYAVWFQSLEPADQAAIAKLSDPDERLEKIRQLLKRPPASRDRGGLATSRPGEKGGEKNFEKVVEKTGEKGDRGNRPLRPDAGNEGRGPGRGPRSEPWLSLVPADYDRVLSAAESKAGKTFSSEQRQELAALTGFQHQLKLVDLLLRQELYTRSGEVPAWAQDPEVVSDLLHEAHEPEFQRLAHKADSPERRRFILLMALTNTTRREFEKLYNPGPAKLQALSEKMPKELRDRMKNVPEDVWRARVLEYYLQGLPSSYPQYVREFLQLHLYFNQKMFNNAKWNPRGPGNGPRPEGRPNRKPGSPGDEPRRPDFRPNEE